MPETKTVIAGSWDNNMYVCLLCIVFVSQSDYLHRKSNNYPQFIRALITRMWANAPRDGHPAEHRWRPLFNAAKFN